MAPFCPPLRLLDFTEEQRRAKLFPSSTVTMVATVHNWFQQKQSKFGKVSGLWCRRGFVSFRLESRLRRVKTNNKKCFQKARLCSYLHSKERMSCPLHKGDDKLFPLPRSSIVYKVKWKNVTLDSAADVLLVTTLLIAKYFLPIKVKSSWDALIIFFIWSNKQRHCSSIFKRLRFLIQPFSSISV